MADDAIETARPGPLVIPPEPDRRRPVFFVSHAIRYPASPNPLDPDPNDHLTTFFRDLSDNVSQLLYRPPGADPGFIDRTLESGSAWEREILTAAGTCQVFIALVSDPYAHRPWCGREWNAFTRRTVWRRGDTTTVENCCLIPVLWAPVREERNPKAIAARQVFVPSPREGIRPEYRNKGIYGLLKTRDAKAYGVVMWDLAVLVSECAFTYWVVPNVPSGSGELRNEFDEEAAE